MVRVKDTHYLVGVLSQASSYPVVWSLLGEVPNRGTLFIYIFYIWFLLLF
jgi:hypothetical protein